MSTTATTTAPPTDVPLPSWAVTASDWTLDVDGSWSRFCVSEQLETADGGLFTVEADQTARPTAPASPDWPDGVWVVELGGLDFGDDPQMSDPVGTLLALSAWAARTAAAIAQWQAATR